jgi:hypothetical protein
MSENSEFHKYLWLDHGKLHSSLNVFSQKRKFNYEFYTNKLKIFYSRVLKDVFIVKNVLVGAFYVVLNDVLVHFF